MSERIETPEQFEAWMERGEYGTYLVQVDGEISPALVWTAEDGEWYGTRPVDEDDGPWADLPEATRATLAVQVGSIAPDGDDDESFTPFTVLWPSAPIEEGA